MPYGLPKDLDTDSNNAKMERCVERVMRQRDSKGNAYGKDAAIAICKSAIIRGAKNNNASLDFFIELLLKEYK